jgi:hypothetical protein
LNIEGGTKPYEVLYTLIGGVTRSLIVEGNTVKIDNLVAGDYLIDVKDGYGLVAPKPRYLFSETKNPSNGDALFGKLPIRLTQPESKLRITTNVLHETCRGSNDGSIEVIVSGGTGPYSINWVQSPVAGYSPLTTDTNGVFKIKGGAGNYRYEVKDKFAECGTTPGDAIEIKEPEVL